MRTREKDTSLVPARASTILETTSQMSDAKYLPHNTEMRNIEERLYALHLPFQVSPQIKRFVNIGILLGKQVYLVDTGVCSSYDEIVAALQSLGKNISDIGGIFLTHSHPDHIGCAARIKKKSGCKVYAPEPERAWIEDIATQFAQRPIPNFYALVTESVTVDHPLRGDEILQPEAGISLRVLSTPGHSHGSLCFYWQEVKTLFTGDAIPAAGDIPIYENSCDSISSLEKLLNFPDVRHYISAWESPCEYAEAQKRIHLALDFLRKLNAVTREQITINPDASTLAERVSEKMGLPQWMGNPLFFRTISSHLKNFFADTNTSGPVYFIVEVHCPEDRGSYIDYVEKARPVVESYGGRYLARTENIQSFTQNWHPDRVVVIRFDSHAALQKCFSSSEYQKIMRLRTESKVQCRAIIVEGIV